MGLCVDGEDVPTLKVGLQCIFELRRAASSLVILSRLPSMSHCLTYRDQRFLALFGRHDVNTAWYLGHFLAVTFGAPYLRCLVLADGFGALERLAAFSATILVSRHASHSRSNSSNEIPLPQFNPAMPQNVVGGGAMEIEVGHHEMH